MLHKESENIIFLLRCSRLTRNTQQDEFAVAIVDKNLKELKISVHAFGNKSTLLNPKRLTHVVDTNPECDEGVDFCNLGRNILLIEIHLVRHRVLGP